MKTKIVFSFVLTALLALSAGTALANDRYVSTSGSDVTGDGTSGNPWATIQYAINNSTLPIPSTLLRIYTQTATININKTVSLRGPQAGVDRAQRKHDPDPGDTSSEAIIDGGGTLATILRIAADDVILDGLEVRNGTGDLIDSLAPTPIKYRRASAITLFTTRAVTRESSSAMSQME